MADPNPDHDGATLLGGVTGAAVGLLGFKKAFIVGCAVGGPTGGVVAGVGFAFVSVVSHVLAGQQGGYAGLARKSAEDITPHVTSRD